MRILKSLQSLFSSQNTVTVRFAVTGMNCASCAARIEQAVRQLPGISSVKVDLAGGRVAVEYEPEAVATGQVRQQIAAAGYTATESAP